MAKGKKGFQAKSEGKVKKNSHKSRKVSPPRRNPVQAGKQAASEARTFFDDAVSSCHQHTRAQGSTAKAVQVEAKAEAEAKAERAAARTVNDASPHYADVKQGVRYTKVVSHTPGGGGDGSSSKSRLSDHGGNQP
jgi:hypothetical protein